ncbi:MAG: hypothetical protein RTU92_02195 [Candidatus Thorarchaeota archaeon]
MTLLDIIESVMRVRNNNGRMRRMVHLIRNRRMVYTKHSSREQDETE